jgi:hypothetical protein
MIGEEAVVFCFATFAVGAAPAVAGAASAISAAVMAARRNRGMRDRSSIEPGIGASSRRLEARWGDDLSPRP